MSHDTIGIWLEFTSVGPLGLPVPWDAPLAGEPLALRVVKAWRMQYGDLPLWVGVDQGSEAVVRACLTPMLSGIKIVPITQLDVPHRARLRRSRQWATHGWRGGLQSVMVFDEVGNMAAMSALATAENLDGLIVPQPASPFVIPELVDPVVANFKQQATASALSFNNAPPGLNPLIVSRTAMEQFAQKGLTPCAMLRYKPDHPEVDIVRMPFCVSAPLVVSSAPYRFCADSDAGRGLCESLLAAGDLSLEGLIHNADGLSQSGELPARDVEIEITGACDVHDTLFPAGATGRRETHLSLDALTHFLNTLPDQDDRVIALGGYGDPLCHPQFRDCLAAAKTAGMGVVVYTYGTRLDDATVQYLVSHADAVVLRLDAHSAQTYGRTKQGVIYDAVLAGVKRLVNATNTHGDGTFVVPSLIKTPETFVDLPDFFQHWYKHVGHVNIMSYDDLGGRLEDHHLYRIEPATQRSYPHLEKLLLLADGSVRDDWRDYA